MPPFLMDCTACPGLELLSGELQKNPAAVADVLVLNVLRPVLYGYLRIEGGHLFFDLRYSVLYNVHAVSLSDGDLLIGPCRLQRPRTTTRDETGQGDPGTKGIIREEEPGPRTCSVNAKVLNPFSRKGR
jgi:hypothetical protein